MKKIFSFLIILCVAIFVSCSFDPEITEESVPHDVQIVKVYTIVINGLSEADGLERIEIYYIPTGKVYDKQKRNVYTKSGEYWLPELMDILDIRSVPNQNPPKYGIPWTIVGNTLTVNVVRNE